MTPSNKLPLGVQLFHQVFILVGLIVTSFVAYRSALSVGFIGDDFVYLTLNIQSIFSMSGFIYRPFGLSLLSLTGHWFDDGAPIVLHSLGIALHAVNSYLLFRFVRDLTGNSLVSLMATVVWLCSMTAIETIYWLSASVFYLPMTCLVLGTLLLAHHRFNQLLTGKRVMSATSFLKLGICLAVLWSCSLMFHEIALVTPLIVVLMFYTDVFFLRPKVSLLSQFLLWLPAMLVIIVYGIVRIAFRAPSQLVIFSVADRIRLLIYAIWRSFLPIDSVLGHDVKPAIDRLPTTSLALAVLFLCATIMILWRSRTLRPIAWGLLVTVITVLPPVVFATVGGRHLYLSSAMGMLTLAIACNIVLEQATRANVLVSKGRLIQGLARIAVFGIFLVILGMNVWRTHGEMHRFMQVAELVRKMEFQVTELVSEPLLAKRAGAAQIRIFLVDFPIVTLTSDGVSRAIHRVIPDLANPVLVTQIYFNDRNPDIIRGGFGGYVDKRKLAELKASAVVLVFCEREQRVFLLDSISVPCLTLDND